MTKGETLGVKSKGYRGVRWKIEGFSTKNSDSF